MRLDKYICECSDLSRSDAKNALKKGRVKVNNETVKSPDTKIDENSDIVMLDYEKLVYEEFVYYMLNKPEGVVSATEDKNDRTVTQLIKEYTKNDLFPVGRLDKDTTGLLILTNDGMLAHKLLSPRNDIYKDYYVTSLFPVNSEMKSMLEAGVDIGDDKPTKPSKVEIIDDSHIILSICEGRFHEVKRMLKAVDNEVTSLKRIKMGALSLDSKLEEGEYRRLTEEEINKLRKCTE